ncbi:DUF4249 family protein [Spirosoma taeanense]|uniref:DUF4249 family protein n=1 Tax=Spirosoma taeanense TaxID=2735870 RepID=UPI001F04F767|nr:DUF4249 family protein [Spirosoma taeanense]
MTLTLPVACIDPENSVLQSTTNILVVDGTITNLPETQIIKLSLARADRLTGQFSTVPLTKAMMEVIIDSAQVLPCHETLDGSFQLPIDFRGQAGHAYQLRFTLPDGTRYLSTRQVRPAVAPIDRIDARFNASSLPLQQLNGYRAAHDVFITSQDPASEHN